MSEDGETLHPLPSTGWWLRQQEAIAPLDEELRFRAAIFREHVLPILEGEAERSRTITTISGGALVASISVFQFLATQPTTANWLLGTSWTLFALAIICNVGVMGKSAHIRAYTLRLYHRRGAIIDDIRGIEDDVARLDRMYELLQQAFNDVEEGHAELAQEHSGWFQTGAWCFLLAFVALIGFGILNL